MVNFGPIPNKSKQKLQMTIAGNMPIAFVPAQSSIFMADVDDGVIIKKLSGHFKPPVCCEFNRDNQVKLKNFA